MREFNDFIHDMELVDVPMCGNNFTWSSLYGKAKRRIDIILLTNKICEWWKVINSLVGDKDLSDHSPIWINMNSMD